MTDAEAVDAAYLKLVDRTQDFLNFLELEGVEYPLFGRTWDVRAPAQRRQAERWVVELYLGLTAYLDSVAEMEGEDGGSQETDTD